MLKKILNFLPNPFILFFIILPLVFGFSYWFFKDDIHNYFSQQIKEEKENIKEENEKDSDGDGLSDWLEINTYKTDPFSIDTDGDGISDYQEIRNKTNPLDPFNKNLDEENTFENFNNKEQDQPEYKKDASLSKTDIVARDLFLKLTEMRLANQDAGKEAIAKLINDLLKENKIFLKQTYTKDDLNISNISVRAFKTNFYGYLKKYDFTNFEDEATLLGKFLETKDEKYLEKIENQIKEYQKFEKGLLELPVPEEVAPLFLNYINSFSLFIQIIKTFGEFKNDPVLVTGMLSVYNKVEDRMSESAKALFTYLKLK